MTAFCKHLVNKHHTCSRCVAELQAKELTSEKKLKSEVNVDLPSIGAGTLRTSTTYAALIIQLEGSRHDQLAVIDSVLEELNIFPEEVVHHRQMPDDEDEWDKWDREGDMLRSKLKV